MSAEAARSLSQLLPDRDAGLFLNTYLSTDLYRLPTRWNLDMGRPSLLDEDGVSTGPPAFVFHKPVLFQY